MKYDNYKQDRHYCALCGKRRKAKYMVLNDQLSIITVTRTFKCKNCKQENRRNRTKLSLRRKK